MSKYLKYLKYLLRHKWFVFVAGIKTGAPIGRLLIHDYSKFFPSEFIPYAKFFYGEKTVLTREAFDYAWLHHQHWNPHHWQHWVLREDSGDTKTLYMPIEYTLEMVADWMGAGRAITGRWDVLDWYTKNRERILLNPSTRHVVELTIHRVTKP